MRIVNTLVIAPQIGDVIDNDQLMQIFQCSPQGGMRRSLSTNTLVLVSHYDGPYGDRWAGDILHYTGMGLHGDQSLNFGQNRTLKESRTSNISLHLFEVINARRYTYRGLVTLFGDPYQEQQKDQDGNQRSVWIFPLKLQSKEAASISEDILTDRAEREEQIAKHASTIEIVKKAKEASLKPSIRISETEHYERNPYVAEYAKLRANGCCQLCNSRAPFLDRQGLPYLENHHVVWLSEGGEDTIRNVVALCPNCHRKMHIVNLQRDRDELKKKTLENL